MIPEWDCRAAVVRGRVAAWTQADIDKLKTAIADGAAIQSLTFANQTYQFRSLEEMLKLLSVMQAEVTSGGRARRYAAFSKGA